MKTTAVRLYGVNDLRMETFELPPIKPGEILAKVISDSICMSSHKAADQGPAHKRVPDDVATNPVIIGHEFCGIIEEVGAEWQGQFKKGQKFTIQPALNYKGSLASPGYSYPYVGGNATYVIIPREVMELGCLLDYQADGYFLGSLTEPMSCIVGTFHAHYHTTNGIYEHRMGIVEGGKLALLACAGPMGLGAIDYALHCDRKPSLVVVTDIDDARLQRAASIITVEEAKKQGIRLVYMNTSGNDAVKELMALTDGKGYDDVMVYAPVAPVIEQGDAILARDGCLNFFAGPSNPDFYAKMNFYNVHYASTHIVGTSGGNTDDMKESLAMMAAGKLNASAMVTHIGGLDCVADTTIRYNEIKAMKRLVYCHISMPLTAIDDFEKLGESDPMYKELAAITKRNNGLWNTEAENYLLAHAKPITA